MFAFVYVEPHQNQSSLLLLIALFPTHLNCKRGRQLKTRSVRGGVGGGDNRGCCRVIFTPTCQKNPKPV